MKNFEGKEYSLKKILLSPEMFLFYAGCLGLIGLTVWLIRNTDH